MRLAALAACAVALGLAAPALGVGPALDGTITTVAGTGIPGRTGNGGPAVAADISHPRGIAIRPEGGFVFAEPFTASVRAVLPDRTIAAFAGTGAAGDSGDGGQATAADLDLPHGVAFTTRGDLLIADTLNDRVRLVAPDGVISTVAGTGEPGFSGDGGPAALAQIDAPRGIAALPDGGFLIADTGNQRVRRVLPDGTIATLAGTGERGFSGDGGPATRAALSNPFSVSPTVDGGFLVADTGNERVRLVDHDGTIATLAGTGEAGFSGDGGPAPAAALDNPHAVAALPDGGFLVADTANARVRHVAPDGTITTVAGTGVPGFSGDGGPATAAQLDEPKALAVLPAGRGFLVGDASNDRVRLVALDLRLPFTLRLDGAPPRTRAGRSAVLRYTLSLAGGLRLDVMRKAKLVLRVRAIGDAGRNALLFGRRLKPGSYSLVAVATDEDGRNAMVGSSLRVLR